MIHVSKTAPRQIQDSKRNRGDGYNYDWQLKVLREKGTLQLLVGDFNPKTTVGKHFRAKADSGDMAEIYIESITKGDRITTVVVRLV